ncbi:MAG: penicillin acylase family protein [Gammaproteobacteria bacterium]|nr:penicillin acylase family protein [Gammaproteobacteria bacterium]
MKDPRTASAGLTAAALLITLAAPVVAGEVEIVRDRYGVPQIYADDTYGLFFGYGHAVAEDRLFQMEMLRRTAEGTAAQVLGEDYADIDAAVRAGFRPADIHRQIAELPAEQAAVLEGYAAGMNDGIAQLQAHAGARMPREFKDYGFSPAPWSAYDVAMLFAGSIAHRFSDFNMELDNLALLRDLVQRHGKDTGWRIFDALQPLYDPASPTTVPDTPDTPVPATATPPPPYLDTLLAQAPPVADRHVSAFGGQRGTGAITPATAAASNVWLLGPGKLTDAGGLLLNGPQFGWSNPSYVYGIGLHGAGFDLAGNTLLALPAVLFAHNAHIGWGSTAGLSDVVDLFRLELDPKDPERYLHAGGYVPFERREEIIAVRDRADRVLVVRYSVHGPVVHWDPVQGIAYAKRRSWEGREVATLLAWVDSARARDFDAWRAAVAGMATNINMYYLDTAGNIGYIHAGRYPQRAPGHDARLPAPGGGAFEWTGWRPFADNPQVFNPPAGYIANWNNRPARGWASSDLWLLNWARVDRVDLITERLRAQPRLSAAQAQAINREIAHADVFWPYLRPFLEGAFAQSAAPAGGAVANALAQLREWDGQWRDDDDDGRFDGAGPAIVDAWLTRLSGDALADDIGPTYMPRYARPDYPNREVAASWGMAPGLKALVRNLDALAQGTAPRYDFFNGEPPATVLRASFAAAVDGLARDAGADPGAWRLATQPLVFSAKNFRGVLQSRPADQPQLPVIMNRGSENNRFVVRDGRICGEDVIPPGQSGYIAADGTRSPHYDDQLTLYRAYTLHPVPCDRSAVQDAAESRTVLHYPDR